jgi:tetratricopeptide (TPR) repeat protein
MSQLADECRLHARRNLDEGKFEFVLQQSDLALASESQANDLLAVKVEALLGLERYDEALGIAAELVHQDANAAEYWLLLCRALRGLGYEDLALRANAYAVDHVALDLETDRFRGDTLFASDRFEEASAAYETTLQRFGQQPQAWELWYNYATCLKDLGRQAEARDANRHALRLLQQLLAVGGSRSEKQHAALMSSLGILYFRLNQYARAERALGDSLVVDGRGTAAYWLAQTYRVQGRGIAAVFILPWIFRNSWEEGHSRRAKRAQMFKQRALILPDTLQQIESLIAQ